MRARVGAEGHHEGVSDRAATAQQARQQFWVRYARLGILATLLTALGLFLYLALSPQRPHASALRNLGLAAAVPAVALWVFPIARLAGSRWRWPFFYVWSLAQVGLITYAAALDGGSQSPLAVALFLPLLYVAMAYPPGGVAVIGLTTLGAFTAISVADNLPNRPTEVLMGTVLAVAGLMAVVGARHREIDHRALARATRRLTEEATIDPLTGCVNRRRFREALADEVARAARHGRPLALLAVDIDRFKEVNDAHGHPAGDRVLAALAELLRRQTRAGDVVARLGGDEFTVLLPECTRADAEHLALRISRLPVQVADVPPVGISVGFAVAEGSGPVDPEELISQADASLYAVKRAAASSVVLEPARPAGRVATHAGPEVPPADQPPPVSAAAG